MKRPDLGLPTPIARWLPFGFTAALASVLAWGIHTPHALLASAARSSIDLDLDGLPDAQEKVLGTQTRVSDSDGDGFGDAEELARGSSPRAANSQPQAQLVDVGISAHARDNGLHVFVLVYTADGTLADKSLTLMTSLGGRVIEITGDALARRGRIEELAARADGAKLFGIDLEIRPATIYAAGEVSFSASIAAPGSGAPGDADVIDLVDVDGDICLRLATAEFRVGRTDPETSNSTNSAGSSTSSTKTGGVYLPIYLQDRGQTQPPSSTSTPGQVCVQETVVVGTANGSIVREVVWAGCVEGWEGMCSTSCARRVGSLLRSLDPVVFAGG